MNLVIMHLNLIKERKSIKGRLNIKDLVIICMQMKMKNHMKNIRERVTIR